MLIRSRTLGSIRDNKNNNFKLKGLTILLKVLIIARLHLVRQARIN